MKKLDLSLNFNEIRKRIEIDKLQYKGIDWAKLTGMSNQSISNIHSKKKLVNPSLEYIIAVAKITGKPIEWYLYGKEIAKPNNIEEIKTDYNNDPFKGISKEDRPYFIKLRKILESNDKETINAIKSNLDAFKTSVIRVDTIKDRDEIIQNMNKRLLHLEKLLDPAGNPTGTDEAE